MLLSDNQAATYNDNNQAPHYGLGSSSSSWDHLLLPLPERKWDRMLFGICTYDSPKEAGLRKAARETSLNYYKYYATSKSKSSDTTICSLKELMSNITLARDPESCRIVYTFVMGGGVGDEALKKHARTLGGQGATTNYAAKTRCLYDDPDCGGRDINQWTLDTPKCNVSDAMTTELQEYNDVTILRIPENHELGKTDTWFTYMAMLTQSRPELQIGFVGKCDSDNLINWPIYLKWIETNFEKQNNVVMKHQQYIYGGYIIHKSVCSGKSWGGVCKNPAFIGQRFAAGAIAYLSTPLAQHVFMDGTSLEQKLVIWILGEDLQLGNMVYSDSNITEENGKLHFMNHRYGDGGGEISNHPLKTYDDMRNKWYELYPDQKYM